MAKLPFDKMAAQLEDIAKDITGEYERKKVYPWDRIADATATIAEAVGAEVPDKKYSTKKAQVADTINAIADADVSGGGGSGSDFARLVDGTITQAHDSTITSIRDYAFSGCSMLSDIDFPNVESIGTYAFGSCPITKAIFPKCTSMGSSIFGTNNIIVQEVNYGALSSLPYQAFSGFSQLTSVSIPNCEKLYTGAFQGCSSLSEVILPKCSWIDGTAFGSCISLESLYILSSSAAILSKPNQYITLFSQTKIPTTGHIYVPASLVSVYETATEWSAFSSRFEGLTDEEIAEILGE